MFLTDIHIQPELNAPAGTAKAVRAILALRPRPDFVITGGDHVMDAQSATRERADLQFRLLREALAPLEMPVHYTLGNHDVYGWGRGAAAEGELEYGKRMFEERVAHGPCRRSFEAGAWRFVILDSIGRVPPTGYRGRDRRCADAVDQGELVRAGTNQPVAMVTHVPLLSLYAKYTNGREPRPARMP